MGYFNWEIRLDYWKYQKSDQKEERVAPTIWRLALTIWRLALTWRVDWTIRRVDWTIRIVDWTIRRVAELLSCNLAEDVSSRSPLVFF